MDPAPCSLQAPQPRAPRTEPQAPPGYSEPHSEASGNAMGHCPVKKKSGLLDREARHRTQKAGVQDLDAWVSAARDEGRVRDPSSR